jgi:hypothetical protein
MSFPARYDSQCPACGERIREGDPVTWAEGFVVHDDCPEPVDPLAVGRGGMCPSCFTERSVTGECSC